MSLERRPMLSKQEKKHRILCVPTSKVKFTLITCHEDPEKEKMCNSPLLSVRVGG
jgi:hypothetical protein